MGTDVTSYKAPFVNITHASTSSENSYSQCCPVLRKERQIKNDTNKAVKQQPVVNKEISSQLYDGSLKIKKQDKGIDGGTYQHDYTNVKTSFSSNAALRKKKRDPSNSNNEKVTTLFTIPSSSTTDEYRPTVHQRQQPQLFHYQTTNNEEKNGSLLCERKTKKRPTNVALKKPSSKRVCDEPRSNRLNTFSLIQVNSASDNANKGIWDHPSVYKKSEEFYQGDRSRLQCQQPQLSYYQYTNNEEPNVLLPCEIKSKKRCANVTLKSPHPKRICNKPFSHPVTSSSLLQINTVSTNANKAVHDQPTDSTTVSNSNTQTNYQHYYNTIHKPNSSSIMQGPCSNTTLNKEQLTDISEDNKLEVSKSKPRKRSITKQEKHREFNAVNNFSSRPSTDATVHDQSTDSAIVSNSNTHTNYQHYYNTIQKPNSSSITQEEVGNAAAFLLSPLASAITGTVLFVDNGMSAMGGAVDSPTLKDMDILNQSKS